MDIPNYFWLALRQVVNTQKLHPTQYQRMSQSSPPGAPKSFKREDLYVPLHTLGFEIDELTPNKVAGHVLLAEKCCQPFRVLHGGVSALIAESLASIGAYLESGLKRVASVWEVRLFKSDPSNIETKTLISTSRVTLLCNLPVPDTLKEASQNLKIYAKL